MNLCPDCEQPLDHELHDEAHMVLMWNKELRAARKAKALDDFDARRNEERRLQGKRKKKQTTNGETLL